MGLPWTVRDIDRIFSGILKEMKQKFKPWQKIRAFPGPARGVRMTNERASVKIVWMKPLDEILDLATTPGRYLPLEQNAHVKDLAEVKLKAAMVFPDLYEVGMSHLGARILYHLINQREDLACERAYAPWVDMEELMRNRGIPLSSLESGLPLWEFDLLGFSLTYELCYTNVLNMLDLAGIPLLASDRREGRWPLVIGGGPCASNPEPVAMFFDAFLFGDGEEAILEICDAVAEHGDGGRDALLEKLAAIEGVYVPEFFEPEYCGDGRIKRIKALKKGHDKVTRRIVADLETAYFPDRPLAPLIEPVHDRVMVEVARGCSRGCRFCHAGIIYRPVRERSMERVLELCRAGLSSTGYEECSLLSLSAGDYSCISELLVALINEHYRDRVSISLPSLRVQGLTDPVLEAIERVRKTGFTLAPEAGTDRLRRVINKDYSERDLLETAARVFSHGWRNLKLYFMVGLPTETDQDVEGIARLANRVAGIRGSGGRPKVTLNITGFVPKPHTPFQWEAQISPERLAEIQEMVRASFSGRGRKVKWQDQGTTRLEGIFSRGDRRLSEVLLVAFRRGLRFDGWSEHFNYQGWLEAFSDAGINPDFYTRQREDDEVFPWDHLDSGVGRDWLREERERAYREETTLDCREQGCINPCGVCDHERIMPRERPGGSHAGQELMARPLREGQPEIFFRYRVHYARRGNMRFMGQLEVGRLFTRAVRRASLPIRYSQGYHPQPRIMFGPSPPVGVASEAEYIDLELISRMGEDEISERLESATPPGIAVLEVQEIPMRSAPITAIITGVDYVAQPPPGYSFNESAIHGFLESESMVITQKRAKGDREVDLRSLVRSLDKGENGELLIGLRVVEGPGAKPQEVIERVFGLKGEELARIRITRTMMRFKQAKPLRYPGRGERTRKAGRGRGRSG